MSKELIQGRRIAQVLLSPELIVGMAAGLEGTLPDGRRIRVVLNDIPWGLGATVENVAWDPARFCFCVFVSHKDFPVVPEGERVPLMRGPTMQIDDPEQEDDRKRRLMQVLVPADALMGLMAGLEGKLQITGDLSCGQFSIPALGVTVEQVAIGNRRDGSLHVTVSHPGLPVCPLGDEIPMLDLSCIEKKSAPV